MEMRKFIVEIHPDGRLTCCEYEEPREACKSTWLAGYRQAVAHCNEEVDFWTRLGLETSASPPSSCTRVLPRSATRSRPTIANTA